MRRRFFAHILAPLGLLMAAGLAISCNSKPSVKDVESAVESDLKGKTVFAGDTLNADISPPLHFRRSIRTGDGEISEIRDLQFGKYDDVRGCWPIKISVTRKVKETHKPVVWPKTRQEVYDIHAVTNTKPWERCIGKDASGKWVLK